MVKKSAGFEVRVGKSGGWKNEGVRLCLSYRPRPTSSVSKLVRSDAPNYPHKGRWTAADEVTEQDKALFRAWVDGGMAKGGGSSSVDTQSPLAIAARSSARVGGMEDAETVIVRCISPISHLGFPISHR